MGISRADWMEPSRSLDCVSLVPVARGNDNREALCFRLVWFFFPGASGWPLSGQNAELGGLPLVPVQ